MIQFDPHSIFRPTSDLNVRDAAGFAGRTNLLSEAIEKLEPDHACLAIYGERGVGKTSFANMVRGLIDRELQPASLQLKSTIGPNKYETIWQTVGPSMTCLEHVLYNLMDPNSGDPSSFAKRYRNIAKRISADYADIKKRELFEGSPVEKQMVLDLFQRLTTDLKAISAGSKKKIGEVPPVLFLDELDRLKSQDGLGHLIKVSKISFVLIGIGETITDILKDHASAERNLGTGNFHIPTLQTDEIHDFFDRGEKAAKRAGHSIRFASSFRKLALEDYGGYPHQLQRLGLETLLLFRRDIEAGPIDEFDENVYVRLLNARSQLEGHNRFDFDMVHTGVEGSRLRWNLLVLLAGDSRVWLDRQRLVKGAGPNIGSDWPKNLEKLVSADLVEYSANKKAWRVASPDLWCEIKRLKRTNWAPKSV